MSEKKKGSNFLFVTGDNYPNGDAGAVRTHVFAKMLKKMGIESTVIGMGKVLDFSPAIYDGVKYYSLRTSKKDVFSRIVVRFGMGRNAVKIIKSLDINSFSGIMYVSGGKKILNYLKKISKEHGIPLFFDAVEWYSPSEFSLREYNPFYISHYRLITKRIDRSMNVIAISSYLENYFSSKGINAVRIPIIFPMEEISYKSDSGSTDKIEIIYAGSPGKKDRILEFIDALFLLSNKGKKNFRVRFIGLTEEKFEEFYDAKISPKLKDIVIFEGRKPREYVVEQLQKADFSFFLRPEYERYAMAGFPTKSVEALSVGTPLLCNITSDLGMYLKDGYNSIIIEKYSVTACVDALERVASLTPEQRNELKANARKTAEERFDINVYQQQFENFIKGAK